MNESESNDEFFEQLAQKVNFEDAPPAPSALKSTIYTRLLQRQQESGPLMSLADVHAGLCVFEKMIAISPLGDRIKRFNPCSVCHARVLAEHLEHAPIYWHNCPYTGFQNR